jgi:O-antigen biosynthesis protein
MKTSIIIAVYNKLDYTRQCIESIRSYTRAGSYEIIVIDNHSEDGTAEWLQAQPDIGYKRNDQNLGFSKACNQGIELASGDTVLLLNNDTIVTPNWLEGLITCLYSNENIGAAGPITNNCSYFQSIPAVYRNTDEMQKFALSHNVSDPVKWEERLKLIGFCMLIRKSVMDTVGFLDERFSPGNYEDDDYSYRIRQAGFRLMLCKDTFIHHFGSTSWEDDASFQTLLRTNQMKFKEKWGFIPEHANPIRFELADRILKPADSAIRVLEINCRGGGTLLLVKSRFLNAELYGIEWDKYEAESAAICAQVKTEEPLQALGSFPEHFFDVILLPYETHSDSSTSLILAAALRCLKPDGQVIGSFTNRLHHRQLKELIQGGHDRGNQSGFVLSEVFDLFRQAGLNEVVVTGSVLPISAEDEISIRQLALLGGGQAQTYEIAAFIVSARTDEAVYCAVRNILENRHADWHLTELSGYPTEKIIALVEKRFDRPQEALQALGAVYLEQGQIGRGLPFMNRAMTLSSLQVSIDDHTDGTGNILDMEQNDVPFTGERLVINKLVKERFSNVLDEHLARYALATRYTTGKHVLDAACGAGYGSLMMLQAGARSVVGVDISEECIRNAKRAYSREDIDFITCDILKLDAADASFDVIVSFETIEHIADGAAWIRETARLLKDGGLFIVSTPNRYVTNPGTYFGEPPLNPHHRFEYSTDEFIGELLQCYDLVEMYGQTVANDHSGLYAKVLRQARGLDMTNVPHTAHPATETDLTPLSVIKNGQAMYHVAICRKKHEKVSIEANPG